MADPDDRDPFGDLPPLFGDLARMMQRQGPMSWDLAKQFAAGVAADGVSEPNVDPTQRFEIEQLARVAELQVASRTGLVVGHSGAGVQVVPVNRAQWSARTLDAYRPLFEAWLSAMTVEPDLDESDPDDPMAWMAPLMKLLGPSLLPMTAGSMVGHLAQRAVGQYELPIPRAGRSDEVVIVLANLDAFGDDWSLPRDDLRLWVCLRDICHHAVLSVPHVAATFDSLLREWLAHFDDAAGGGLDGLLGGFDPTDPASMGNLQSMLGDPEVLLGAVISERQQALRPRIEALVAAIVGYVDWVMDEIGGSLIGSYGQVTEAMRRRRVEASGADRLVERIFGLELGQAQYDRAEAFAAGVVERAGAEGLHRLWETERTLPTPAEIDAPGLWLARIDLPDE